MTKTSKSKYKNFFNLGKGERTFAWVGCDAGELPLYEFRKGVLKKVLQQWSRVKIEHCSLGPYNYAPLFTCHECGFIFEDSEQGEKEHQIFHTKQTKWR